jgi:hypothetical protein
MNGIKGIVPKIWSIFHRVPIQYEREIKQEIGLYKEIKDWIWDTPIGTILKVIIKK